MNLTMLHNPLQTRMEPSTVVEKAESGYVYFLLLLLSLRFSSLLLSCSFFFWGGGKGGGGRGAPTPIFTHPLGSARRLQAVLRRREVQRRGLAQVGSGAVGAAGQEVRHDGLSGRKPGVGLLGFPDLRD